MEQGAAFDLIRGSINLGIAGALIALGTSLKLPHSTTFVTFMVAMGTSLADKAWVSESAIFRITGVISVIGGWFITAGAAFIGACVITLAMHYGGHWVMFALTALTLWLVIRSNRRFNEKREEEEGDTLLQTILTTDDRQKTWNLTLVYIVEQQRKFIECAKELYNGVTEAFIKENAGGLSKADKSLEMEKRILKNARRKETRDMASTMRKYLRAFAKLHDTEFRSRTTPATATE